MKILVTGSQGQVGQALQLISADYSGFGFYFADSGEGDVTDIDKISALFEKVKPDFCINAAAYTAVDKAESEPEKAFAINTTGASNLSTACKAHNTTLLHISTDFVFDGTKRTAYTEEDETNPLSVYGATKLGGERAISEIWHKHFVVRTAWVYSQFGNNFMKTMLRLATERSSLSIVDDQIGSPTHAVDLAKGLMHIIETNSGNYGMYHYSSEGSTSWYGFAKKIFEVNNISIDLTPIPTSAYPTPAKRPEYSVMDKSKLKSEFGVIIRDWKEGVDNLG